MDKITYFNGSDFQPNEIPKINIYNKQTKENLKDLEILIYRDKIEKILNLFSKIKTFIYKKNIIFGENNLYFEINNFNKNDIKFISNYLNKIETFFEDKKIFDFLKEKEIKEISIITSLLYSLKEYFFIKAKK